MTGPKITPPHVTAVLALQGPARYEHFVKTVADWQEAWGLYDSGWALAETDDGKPVFLLWPTLEYAALCADGQWSEYEPKAITLEDLLTELLPQLESDGTLPGIFYAPSNKGVTLTVQQLRQELAREMKKYP